MTLDPQHPQHRQKAAKTGINRRQSQAIAALLAHPTVAQAAAAAQVGERTLRDWMAQPAFTAAYGLARQQLITTAIGNLHHSATAAARALKEIAEDGMAPPAARVSAARAILESSFRGAELMEIEERLTSIETRIAGKEGK